MTSPKIVLLICVALAVMAVTRSDDAETCKELNQVNCYVGQNEGYYCSKNDHSVKLTRWYHDKGICRKFTYKGCYGNRNRFCSRASCERRCEV